MKATFPELSAHEAAQLIYDGEVIGFSSFASAGDAKNIPKAIAQKALEEHNANKPFKISVVTGASTGDALDGELARANAIDFRTPFQTQKDLRERINNGDVAFFDLNLSQLPEYLRYGYLPSLDWAIIQAASVSNKGEILLTNAVGATPSFCHAAKKILIELNEYHPPSTEGIHDIYIPLDPPNRKEIPIYTPSDRIGDPFIHVDPKKIAGIVKTNLPDDISPLKSIDSTTKKIGQNLASFLVSELKSGRLPQSFLPMQFGIGNIANAVLAGMTENPEIPSFSMYSEIIQDSAIDLLQKGKIKFASATAIAASPDFLRSVYDNLPFFKKRILLRPQEISNHPEVIRRLGVITVNTALEVGLIGNINSTHVMGRQIINGIGGSIDFSQHAYLSIFACPSLAKHGNISTFVPLVTHVDHTEHSVHVVVTENGVADLRSKSPYEKAQLLINNCVHQDFREPLMSFLHKMKSGHSPHALGASFAMHEQFLKTGHMQGVTWKDLL